MVPQERAWRRLLITFVVLCVWAALPAWGVQITRGPYLQLQTPDSVSVVWFTDSACTGEVEWGLTTSYGNLAQSTQPGTYHEIAVTGLSPDTLYHYRARCDSAPLSGDATFRTAPPSGASAVSFSFVGDSCSAPSNCTATYNAMLSQSPNGFCVTLGDLAGRGEDNITDYWQSHFFTPAAGFIKHVCMHTTIGNHELYDETATYVYPTRYLANWSPPTASSGSEFYYSFDKAHVHFAAVDTFWSSYASGSAQYDWLAGDLAGTTQPWKIVFGHNGPYVSEDGSSNGSTTMRTSLVPLFQQHGVDLYLHGHYHNYQRNVVNGVCYIDQGTGGQPWSAKHADDSQPYVRAYADQYYCFTRLDIQGNRLLGRCLKTSDGTVLDGFQIDKPPIAMPWQDAFPAAGPQLNWIAPWNFGSQCGLVARPGNPSGDGYVFEVADTSGHQYAYPMLANESLTNQSIEAKVYYDNNTSVKNRFGVGLRGRLFFSAAERSYYALVFVRNDSLAANGHCVLIKRQDETETVLADWTYPDVSGWHKMRLSMEGSELRAWVDDQLLTATPVQDSALPKGRPFIYNYRNDASGAKSLVDDVTIGPVVVPPVISQHPVSQTVYLGENAVFSVTASGFPPVSYQWQKDSVDLAETGHYSGVTTASLTVSNADGTDVGSYRCVVSNSEGSATSNAASLTVGGPRPVKADFDEDGDVDQKDFGHFQSCLSGSSLSQDDPECQNTKFDGDSDVDENDFALFRQCISGAGVSVDPDCLGD